MLKGRAFYEQDVNGVLDSLAITHNVSTHNVDALRSDGIVTPEHVVHDLISEQIEAQGGQSNDGHRLIHLKLGRNHNRVVRETLTHFYQRPDAYIGHPESLAGLAMRQAFATLDDLVMQTAYVAGRLRNGF